MRVYRLMLELELEVIHNRLGGFNKVVFHSVEVLDAKAVDIKSLGHQQARIGKIGDVVLSDDDISILDGFDGLNHLVHIGSAVFEISIDLGGVIL